MHEAARLASPQLRVFSLNVVQLVDATAGIQVRCTVMTVPPDDDVEFGEAQLNVF